jgi:hypothetical protein
MEFSAPTHPIQFCPVQPLFLPGAAASVLLNNGFFVRSSVPRGSKSANGTATVDDGKRGEARPAFPFGISHGILQIATFSAAMALT